MLELLNDNNTHKFDPDLSNLIFNFIHPGHRSCRFCNTKLNPDEAFFYQHDGGWQTSTIKEKIWIWFECPKCGHQWSLSHLGVSRDQILILNK